MIRERIIRLFAGAMVLTGLCLGIWANRWWLALCAFVGLNLFQSALTKWCLMDDILRKAFHVPSEADKVRRAAADGQSTKPNP